MSWWFFRMKARESEPQDELKKPEDGGSVQTGNELLNLQQRVGNQAVQRVIGNLRNTPDTAGQPLPSSAQQSMEASFGENFGDVRIHADDQASRSAQALGANAYTVGRDIYFARGAYDEATLAHELAHVVQQRNATHTLPAEEHALEQEAERAAGTVNPGGTPRIAGASAVPALQRQINPDASKVQLLPSKSVTLDAFGVNSFALTSGHHRVLDRVAEDLKATLAHAPDTFVSIAGFADAPGTEPHNLSLGQQRADAVRTYLIGRGVPENVLRAFSLGEELLRVETKNYEAKNRRVEIDIHERSFFKPTLPLTPPAPAPDQPPIDLNYHPKIHVPTPQEEVEENVRRNEEIWKKAQEILKQERERPGTSISDVFGRAGRGLAKKLGLPEWAQDRAASFAEDLPAKGLKAVFDQIASDRSLDQGTKDSIKAVIDALMKSKVK